MEKGTIVFELNWTFHEIDPHSDLATVLSNVKSFAKCEVLEVQSPKIGTYKIIVEGTMDKMSDLICSIPWNNETTFVYDGKCWWEDDFFDEG
jgi:hypothetical protein